MSDYTQTIPELVSWARKSDFAISLPVERLAFLLAIATLNGERVEGELTESELLDAFKHVSAVFEQSPETVDLRGNNAINDMVKQRILNRFTSEQAEGYAIYRLTPLAIGITDYYVRQKEFSTLRLSMQLSIVGAERGHQVTLCDVSEQMLQRATQHAQQQGVATQMTFIQTSAQQIGEQLEQPVDLVLFHAVLEWVAEPEKTLAALFDTLSPGGVLSLMFYNLHGLTLQNLTLGNFGYLKAHMKKRKKKTLSPDYPRDPAEVDQWLHNVGFQIEDKAGIRVFSDFIRDLPPSANGEEGIIEMERRYCRQEPFMSLGRYIHVTARKPAIKDEL